ncbi:LxmA leader domain family RiPP, partial [Streptomyces sp. DH10]
MDKSVAIMELVSNYDAYADVDELNISAAADAPATTPVCAASVASSSW